MSRWYDQHRVNRRLRKLEALAGVARGPRHAQPGDVVYIPTTVGMDQVRQMQERIVMPLPHASEPEDFAATEPNHEARAPQQ